MQGSEKCCAHGGGRKCVHCVDWIDSRLASSHFDGYCGTCFRHVFPNDPRSAHASRARSHEECVRLALIEAGYKDFVHDQAMWTGNCSCVHRRRVDFRQLIEGTILAIEVDEHRHSGYDKKDEELRYDDLAMIHSGKWIFIRFNPDNTRQIKTPMKVRLQKLLDTVALQIQRIQEFKNLEIDGLLEIIYLYY